jgi:PhnB protein
MAFGPNPPRIQAHICVKGGEAAIAFYEQAFNGVCAFKQMARDGTRVQHANIELFGAEVMLHDEFPEHGGDVLAPSSVGGASVALNVNLAAPGDVDAALARARAAGATVICEPEDMFWGARYGRVRDPFGHVWAFNAPLAIEPAAAPPVR